MCVGVVKKKTDHRKHHTHWRVSEYVCHTHTNSHVSEYVCEVSWHTSSLTNSALLYQFSHVKGYVNCMSMPEYGLDFQSRHSKSCVVNDGSLSTEVLRVVICVPRYKKWIIPFVLEVKEMAWEPRRVRGKGRDPQNPAHFSQYFPAAWSHPRRAMLQVLHLNIPEFLCFLVIW